jgi:hypothetical protein
MGTLLIQAGGLMPKFIASECRQDDAVCNVLSAVTADTFVEVEYCGRYLRISKDADTVLVPLACSSEAHQVFRVDKAQ